MTSADVLNRQGAELFLRGDLDGARLHYVAALQVDRNYLPALANLISVLNQQNRLAAAAVYCQQFLNTAPNDARHLNILGNLLMRLEKHDKAQPILLRASEVAPDDPAVWYNLSLLSHWTGKYEFALKYMDKVEALGASSPRSKNDRAHMELALGENLNHALALYEARWHSMIHLLPWDFHIPEWQGQSLRDKTILLHGEQGYGDSIMTSRFARNLVDRGAKEVALCLPGSLCGLFEAQEWPNVSVLDIEKLNPTLAKRFDFQSPMYSAMRWLGIEQKDISPEPYLTAPLISVPSVEPGYFNVGIVWASGARGNELDWRRRISNLELWLPLAEVPGVKLFSLQKGEEALEIQSLGAEALIVDHSEVLTDWSITAAFINKLDLVISVDTAVVHLAGALGKPCWMLSQFSRCWRWWQATFESGRPWYDSVSIIRQERPGGWATQLKKAKIRLEFRDQSSQLRVA